MSHPVNQTATFDAAAPLAYGTTYTVSVSGVKDSAGNALASPSTWSFTTSAAPEVGSGGPILVVTTAANPFSSYYAEILRAEGLNEFATADIASLTRATPDAHQVVILGEATL